MPGSARCRRATPVTAPVRIAETTVPSITASGRPVSRLVRSTRALARGRPFRLGLSGTLGIHLSPATSNSPPTYAGIAMMRPSRSSVPGSSAQVIMALCGIRTSPAALTRKARSMTSTIAAMSVPPEATTSSCERKTNSGIAI